MIHTHIKFIDIPRRLYIYIYIYINIMFNTIYIYCRSGNIREVLIFTNSRIS